MPNANKVIDWVKINHIVIWLNKNMFAVHFSVKNQSSPNKRYVTVWKKKIKNEISVIWYWKKERKKEIYSVHININNLYWQIVMRGTNIPVTSVIRSFLILRVLIKSPPMFYLKPTLITMSFSPHVYVGFKFADIIMT